MKRFWILLFVLPMAVCGCKAITQEDLAKLRSPNHIVKRETLEKVSKSRNFPFTLLDRFVGVEERKTAVDIIVELLRSGKEADNTEKSLIRTLGDLSRYVPVPLDVLVARLKDEDREIRILAMEALGKSKTKEACGYLLGILKQEEGSMMYPLIWAIGQTGTPEAVLELNRLLDSDDKYVSFNAYKALSNIAEMEADQATPALSAVASVDAAKKSDASGWLETAFETYQKTMAVLMNKVAASKQ